MKIGPRFHVVDEIARGGMGVVMLALQLDGHGKGSPVAIKQLHAHLVDHAEVVTSFVDEARIASRIVHPNVVRVLDVEMVKDQLVIVMEYVEGVPLRDLVRSRENGLPLPIVRRILVDALNGLHAAHELVDDEGAPLGVVHRDVSPHNLLVGLNGVTRVTDFGIAVAAGRIASTKPDGAVKGKLQYLSPEQVFRQTIDRRTDVFAAGVVAWEAIVGRKLFEAGTEGETLAMIIREPIAPPSSQRLDVGLELDETVLRALEREPDRRFESAYAFARAIEEGGPMATRKEVEDLVLSVAGDALTARRARVAAAEFGALSAEVLLDDEAPTLAADSRPLRFISPATVEPVPRRTSSASPMLLVVVGSICVTGGLLAGFSVRSSSPAQTHSDTTSATPATSASSDLPDPSTTSALATSTAPPATTTPPNLLTATPSTGKAIHRLHGGSRRSDAGAAHGSRPFMPDDL